MAMDWAVNIAARLLGGEEGSMGLLHYDLCSVITIAEARCRNAGGRLVSTQALAAIILAWGIRSSRRARIRRVAESARSNPGTAPENTELSPRRFERQQHG